MFNQIGPGDAKLVCPSVRPIECSSERAFIFTALSETAIPSQLLKSLPSTPNLQLICAPIPFPSTSERRNVLRWTRFCLCPGSLVRTRKLLQSETPQHRLALCQRCVHIGMHCCASATQPGPRSIPPPLPPSRGGTAPEATLLQVTVSCLCRALRHVTETASLHACVRTYAEDSGVVAAAALCPHWSFGEHLGSCTLAARPGMRPHWPAANTQCAASIAIANTSVMCNGRHVSAATHLQFV